MTDDDIDEWIDRLRERFAELEPADRPLIEGDFATIDVKAVAEGEDIDGLTEPTTCTSSDRGVRADARCRASGDEGRRDPQGDRADGLGGRRGAQGQAGRSHGADQGREGTEVPEADDDFAKTASEFDTLDQLRDDLRERLGEIKEREGVARFATGCSMPWSTRSTSTSPRR